MLPEIGVFGLYIALFGLKMAMIGSPWLSKFKLPLQLPYFSPPGSYSEFPFRCFCPQKDRYKTKSIRVFSLIANNIKQLAWSDPNYN